MDKKKMASIKDVATLAGVGVGTVSRVMNESGYVSEEARKKVDAAVRKLNFQPNVSAQSLKSQKSGVVGLFVPVLNHPFFCALSEKIEHRLYESGYQTLMVCSQGMQEKELMVLSMLAQKRVDGAIFITHYNLGEINGKLPIVTMDRHFGENVPCVTSDNYASTKKAVEYLIACGCKKIAYVGGKPAVESEVSKRLDAYLDAVQEHGMAPRVLYEEFEHGKDYEYAETFFSRYGGEADGVFCSGDILTNAVYQLAVQRGISIPQQLKIVSYDGIMRDWQQKPNITSIVQDLDGISLHIVKELLNKMEGKPFHKSVVVPATFVAGETT